MTKAQASTFGLVAILLFTLVHTRAADAQAARTWVSGSSIASDSNPCTRDSPCATFAYALSQTMAGGEIDVLDGGDFGKMIITKAITIANDGPGTAAITPRWDSGVHINAGASDAVVLRGLTINGLTAGADTAGIMDLGGGSLVVDHCTIQGFPFMGILFEPGYSTSSDGKLVVKNTVLLNDGGGGTFPALGILAINGFTATASLERVQILNAIGNGVRADSTFSGAVDVELHDVTVDAASGGAGIVAVSQTSGGPAARILADNVTSSHNPGYGIRAVGGMASVVLSRSVIEDNGVGIGASSGGVVYSYGDNRFANNVNGDGVTPTPITLK